MSWSIQRSPSAVSALVKVGASAMRPATRGVVSWKDPVWLTARSSSMPLPAASKAAKASAVLLPHVTLGRAQAGGDIAPGRELFVEPAHERATERVLGVPQVRHHRPRATAMNGRMGVAASY